MPVLSLGYVRLVSPRLDEWHEFCDEVLGLMPTAGPRTEAQYWRMDKYPYRLVMAPGAEPAIEAIGYEVADDRALDGIAARVEAAGYPVEGVGAEGCAERLVSGCATFSDPAGLRVELFHGPVFDHTPLVTPAVTSFVTGSLGMGHVVLNVDNLEHTSSFYRDTLEFHRRNTWFRPPMAMEFLGCNSRHHTLALAQGLPMTGRMGHLMIEVATIDDVGYAQDRCLDRGVPVRMGLGRHTNDHMVSFYCGTPDGFLVEFGWGGIEVGPAESEPTYQITKPSFWGHRPLTAG